MDWNIHIVQNYLRNLQTREDFSEAHQTCVAAFNMLRRGQQPSATQPLDADVSEHQRFARYVQTRRTTAEINEVIKLNNAMIRAHQQSAARTLMIKFHHRQRVAFAGKRGERIEGTVVNFGQKRVTVVADGAMHGCKWHVPPSKLTAI